MILSARSELRLHGVHPDLVKIVRKAAADGELNFVVIEGLRTIERQKQLVAAGASTTMRSRHITGHAVDLAAMVGDQVRWDWPLYDKLAVAMKTAAHALSIPLEWGGDWHTFKDGPHFQLPWSTYP